MSQLNVKARNFLSHKKKFAWKNVPKLFCSAQQKRWNSFKQVVFEIVGYNKVENYPRGDFQTMSFTCLTVHMRQAYLDKLDGGVFWRIRRPFSSRRHGFRTPLSESIERKYGGTQLECSERKYL